MAPRSRQSARGGGTPATAALERAGLAFTTHAYTHDPAAPSSGLEAAAQLGVDPTCVFKTLVAVVDGQLVVTVVPVTGQLDLKALAAAVAGKKAAMADPQQAERATGYLLGGISPVGQKRRLRTVIDTSATRHSIIYVSGGKRGLDLALSPHDLLGLLEATVADIGRP